MSSGTTNDSGTESKASEAAELSAAKRALLARRLRGLKPAEQLEQGVQPRADGAQVPISVDQYRIWVHHSMHPKLPTYNEPITLRYRGWMEPELLKRSLEYFVSRREIWRTSFRMENGRVYQQIHSSLSAKVEFADLRSLPEAEREAEAKRLATAEAKRPFALDEVPLFRVLLVRMAEDDHRLYMVIHHIVFDGTSVREAFAPEIAAIYAALAAGRDPGMPARPLQYGDYTLWRERQLASAAMQQSMEFWRRELAGELPPLRLPADRPRPPVVSQRGAFEPVLFSRELTERLNALSRERGASLYATLLAALNVLLFRYSGQADVVIGTGASGRRRPELQGMMGYMLDTFPVRTRPVAEQTFASFLKDTQAALFGALGAAEVPFDRIVQAVGIKGDPSYHPIFQTFFSYLSPAAPLPDEWEIMPKEIDNGSAKFDLYVEAEEWRGQIAACVLYTADLFEAETIKRLAGHWTTLLEGIVREPECRLGELPLLTEAERELILVEWNRATIAEVPRTTMHDLVQRQAEATPDKPAVVFNGATWTYGELARKAEFVAEQMRAAGAGPGRLAAICIDRSAWLIAGLLGILKTGAAYLPLDPGTPESRIALCLEDAQPVVVLTQKALAAKLPMGSAKVLLIEELMDAEGAWTPDEAATASAGAPDDAAYVIHTSGSTGRPKAVEIPHQAAVNLLLSMQREPGFTAEDVLVAVTTVSFDIAVLELFLPIITGGKVVIADYWTTRDPFELMTLIEKSRCTVMQATPATWRALLAAGWRGREGLKVLCGGEALTRDLAEKLLALGLELWNVYGPTETTIWSTTERVRSGKGAVPIGKPIANTTTYILDVNRQPVPVGVPGELCIGGMGVANGYRGQPELTAEKFIRPEVTAGERVYRTGDYAVYRADGTIECQGRVDNQVKVRGHRMELEEIELHLSAHPQVASAATKVWPDAVAGNKLSAYVVARGEAPTTQQMREFLRGRLPEYMIPSDFTLLEALPLTPNGKLDRKALPEPHDASLSSVESDGDELSGDEARLAAIWQEVLGVERVRGSDNFFDLGGHSLLLVRLFAEINRQFATALPITTIYDAQTVGEVAKVLKRELPLSSLVPVQTQGSRRPLFIAHSYLLYRTLSQALGDEQPVYGLRELESDSGLSLQQRAAHYVADMRSVQPRGPYCVAGWCAAAPIAVEIARQLVRSGEEVASLELFDAWMPGYEESVNHSQGRRSTLSRIFSKVGQVCLRVAAMPWKEAAKSLWRTVQRAAKQARDDFYIAHLKQLTEWSEKLHLPLPEFVHSTSLQTFAALREFKPEAFPVRITLIRAEETRLLPGGSESCGWEQIAENGVTVLWAPGDHETMFRGRNLDVTAGLIRQALDA